MDSNGTDASATTVKKKVVFTTAHKKANSIENKCEEKKDKVAESLSLKESTAAKPSKTKKPIKPKQPEGKPQEEPKAKPDNPPKNQDDNVNVDSVGAEKKKKSSRRRRKSKKSETSEICKELSEMTVKESPNSPILSADAVPFVPESPVNKMSVNVPDKPVRKPVSRPKPVVKSEQELRSVEIKQLQIRFSPTGFSQKKNFVDDSVTLQCVLPITDPDFAYDLETIRLEISLPKGYPGTKTDPIRPAFTIMNSDLPSAIISRIERNLRWGLNSLEGGVLVCRPMLRYLEDNLEKWMVDDVRESAFKFVKPSEIKVTEKSVDSEESSSSGSESEEDEKLFLSKTTPEKNSQVSSRISVGDWISPPPLTDQSSVGGNPFTLKLIFSLIRGVDLFTSQRITFLASCDRCKFNFPVEDLRPFVDRIEHCPKCTNQTKFHYKSQLITPGANFEDGDDEFEAVLGSIRFLRAKPVDLLPSLYQCACSRCYGTEENEEYEELKELKDEKEKEEENIKTTGSNSSTNNISCKIEKVKIGENISYGCFNCHQKIRFQIDRIEWISDAVPTSAKKTTNSASKGPTLTVGNPLPLNGACEHYKKSFRWYRFPCCGQAFPCDECHAKDPVAKGHPVEWATRFICGFCSREQSISVKECPECGKDTSAAGRKHTAFWEGGKGIRNQILMSRKDSKKYKDYSLNSKAKKKTT